MHCLYAAERQVAELKRVIEAENLADVTLAPAFLGKVVVWCQSERSHDVLADVLAAREPQAA